MTTRLDLDTRAAIDRLMIAFYAKATADDVIGEFFSDVVPFDLRHHLPIIGDFWESVLLGTQAYRAHNRNPLQLHAELDALEPLHPAHFDRWLTLFRETVDELFAGPRAEFAKARSGMIARRMLEIIAASRLASGRLAVGSR
jgi:hemoglobin